MKTQTQRNRGQMVGIPSSEAAIELIGKKRFDLLITEIEPREPEADMEAVAEACTRGLF